MKIDIIFEKQEEGGYTVYVPALPGCISQGDTKQEAQSNILEAISLYVEEIEKNKLKKILTSISVQRRAVKINA
ncbi:MAG: type II toxin-antitoxin system HicB family antitoxin [archaeon]